MKDGGGGRKRYTKYTEPLSDQGSLFGSDESSDPCSSIKFITQLQNVQPSITTVIARDELSLVNLKNEIQAFNEAGSLCGYVVSPYNAQLIKCMINYHYKAVVNSISGTVCKVTVQLK